ncbi:hypothetical protein AB0953_29710 [Streptomyces sp. NPDC046866]|uniref:hypothetical protein n=1 Tax=Streptomyces sp. NPDC046866 TaxID=3154921 RepID=UPI003451BF0C
MRLHATPAPGTPDAAAGQLSYDIERARGQSQTLLLTCRAARADGDQVPAPPAPAVKPALLSQRTALILFIAAGIGIGIGIGRGARGAGSSRLTPPLGQSADRHTGQRPRPDRHGQRRSVPLASRAEVSQA